MGSGLRLGYGRVYRTDVLNQCNIVWNGILLRHSVRLEEIYDILHSQTCCLMYLESGVQRHGGGAMEKDFDRNFPVIHYEVQFDVLLASVLAALMTFTMI